MLKLRLQRRGKRNHVTYRIVVADQRAPIKGRFIDDLGYYDPHQEQFSVDGEKARQWITKGAQPSPTVHNLLVEHNILKADKVTSWKPKKKEQEEGAEEGKTEKAPVEAKEVEQSESKQDKQAEEKIDE